MDELEELRAENERLRADVEFLKRPTTPCKFCGAPSTRLCDRVVARCIQTGEDLVCSAAMCDSSVCGTQSDGPIFYCGSGGCDIDFTDNCKDHKGASFGSPPLARVSRTRLYQMEKEGVGLILVKQPGPELVE